MLFCIYEHSSWTKHKNWHFFLLFSNIFMQYILYDFLNKAHTIRNWFNKNNELELKCTHESIEFSVFPFFFFLWLRINTNEILQVKSLNDSWKCKCNTDKLSVTTPENAFSFENSCEYCFIVRNKLMKKAFNRWRKCAYRRKRIDTITNHLNETFVDWLYLIQITFTNSCGMLLFWKISIC